VVDPSKKVPDPNCEAQDLLLEVVDLKQEAHAAVVRCLSFVIHFCQQRNKRRTSFTAVHDTAEGMLFRSVLFLSRPLSEALLDVYTFSIYLCPVSF